MFKELDDYGWKNAFGEDWIDPAPVINSRGISLAGINREAVDKIIAMIEGENDGPFWTGIFKLKDGRFISVCSGCDYTGWDCKAEGEIFVAHDEDSIKRFGLSEEERKRLNIILPELKDV